MRRLSYSMYGLGIAQPLGYSNFADLLDLQRGIDLTSRRKVRFRHTFFQNEVWKVLYKLVLVTDPLDCPYKYNYTNITKDWFRTFWASKALRTSEPAPWRPQVYNLQDTDLNTLSTQTHRDQELHGYTMLPKLAHILVRDRSLKLSILGPHNGRVYN